MYTLVYVKLTNLSTDRVCIHYKNFYKLELIRIGQPAAVDIMVVLAVVVLADSGSVQRSRRGPPSVVGACSLVCYPGGAL